MSKRAEQAALKAYPFIPLPQYDLRDENPTDGNKIHRRIFLEGYEQAEKDLALTWEDIPLIEELINEVHNEYPCGLSAQCFGEEVLRRFNELKNKN